MTATGDNDTPKLHFAVVILLEVSDPTVTHEQLYDVVPKIEHPGVRELYADVDPDPGSRLTPEEMKNHLTDENTEE
jgi:hypothetical protein